MKIWKNISFKHFFFKLWILHNLYCFSNSNFIYLQIINFVNFHLELQFVILCFQFIQCLADFFNFL